jgi:predicted kinase
MGLVVELCGLPGAGKSTIARAVVARLRLQGLPVTDVMAPIGPAAARPERLARKAGILARSAMALDTWRVAADVGLRSGQRDRRDRVARPMNLVVVRTLVARGARRPGVHVLDQGPVQEWWSAALRGDARRVLAWAAADGPSRADLVVRVDAPIDVLVERLGGRSGRQSRLEALDEPGLRADLIRGEVLLDELCSQLVHSCGTHRPRLIRVDGLDTAAGEIVGEAIAELR